MILVFIGLLVAVPGSIYAVKKIKNHFLLQSVIAAVQADLDKVQLLNEVSENKYVSGSGCYYDHKVRATRCNVGYTKYFVADEQPVDELILVDKYLTDLGWSYYSEHRFSRDEYTRMLEKGYMPFGIYVKKNPYPLELHVKFIGERDREFSDQKLTELLDRFTDQHTSIYSVSISSDIVP